jgi:hypothetical protein
MFDFFTRHTAKDLVENAKNLYMPLPQRQTVFPSEHFRVGVTQLGETTLTLMTEDGPSVTITMSQTACEKLIRMLQSTFTELEPTEGDDLVG